MWMDVRIYSVKALNMSLYNHKTKRPKSQDTQLEISKIPVLWRKIELGGLGPGETTARLSICLWEHTWKANFKIHLLPKSYFNFT